MKKLRKYAICENVIYEAVYGSVSKEKLMKYIKDREVINFYYEDPTDAENPLPGPRTVEPYVIGRRKNGRYYLRAYMIADTSKDEATMKMTKRRSTSKSAGPGKAKRSGWRLFRIDRIQWLVGDGKIFSRYRAGYNENGDKQLDTIIFQLKKSDFPYGENPNTLF